MKGLSFIFAKLIRRILLPIVSWYRKTLFLSGLKKSDPTIEVKGPVYLWNENVSISEGTNIYPNVTLWGPGNISIGSHVELGTGTIIYSSKSISIGNYVNIAANCYIIDSNHGIKKNKIIQQQANTIKGPVIIEDDVWLGAGVTVLSGVHIHKGAVIGAGAVVNSDVPANAIYVGVPAKIIGYRKN